MNYETTRLYIKEVNDDDFNNLYTIFSDDLVMRYTYLDNFKTHEELLPLFNQMLLNNSTTKNRKEYVYLVFQKSDNDLIGFAVIEIQGQSAIGKEGELGYLLLPSFWNKGYATEIAKKLLEIGFIDIKLHRMIAKCNVDNTLSENVMKKIQMIKEGHFRQKRFKNGSWHDELQYAIIKEEYEKIK